MFGWFKRPVADPMKRFLMFSVDLFAEDGDEFKKIVPIGTFRKNGTDYTINRTHIEQMFQNFEQSKVDLLFDYEHHSILMGDTRAAGWGKELQVRDDGLYVKLPGWTKTATAMIADREYRYLSPAIDLDTEDKFGRHIGATIDHVALTNKPFFDNEVDPILNSKNDSSESIMDKNLLKLLGLAETATQADVDAKLAALRGQYQLTVDATLDQIIEAAGKVHKPADKPAEEPKPAEGIDVEARVKAEVAAALQEREAEVMVSSAIADARILPAEKAIWLNSAKADFAQTKIMLEARQKRSVLPGKMQLNSRTGDDKSAKNPNDECAEAFRQMGRNAH